MYETKKLRILLDNMRLKKAGKKMMIQFEGIYERDMDLLFMRKFATDTEFVREYFLKAKGPASKGYDRAEFSVEKYHIR